MLASGSNSNHSSSYYFFELKICNQYEKNFPKILFHILNKDWKFTKYTILRTSIFKREYSFLIV